MYSGGDTGPVWIGSGLAIIAAIVVFFFIPSFHEDFMIEEDLRFRGYLEDAGYDTSVMGVKALLSDDALDQTARNSYVGQKEPLVVNEKTGIQTNGVEPLVVPSPKTKGSPKPANGSIVASEQVLPDAVSVPCERRSRKTRDTVTAST